jgi:hypothetical protein
MDAFRLTVPTAISENTVRFTRGDWMVLTAGTDAAGFHSMTAS